MATGCGAVRPGPGKVASYRAEAYGVPAAMRNLFAERRAAGVDLYLENKAVVDVFNTPVRRAMAAADVWDEIRHWSRLWGATFKVRPQLGHPERRQPDSTRWTVLEAANHVADGLEDVGRYSRGHDIRGTFEFGRR